MTTSNTTVGKNRTDNPSNARRRGEERGGSKQPARVAAEAGKATATSGPMLAEAKPQQGVTVSVETITPEIAQQMLSGNVRNFRKMSEGRARALADVMSRGHFRFNGEKIHIRADGSVADGQTRLRACVISGVSFKTVVVRGDVEDESNIDTGSKRTAGQLLHFHGVMNANSAAAAVKAHMALFERKTMSHLTYVAPIAASEVKEWLDKHPQMIESVRIAADSPSGIFQALVAAIHYQGMGIDQKHTEWWVKALISGKDLEDKDLPENDPVRRLRGRFHIGGKRVMLTRIEQAALLIKSWNLSRWGRPVKSVTWRGSGPHPEDFPVLGAAAETDSTPVAEPTPPTTAESTPKDVATRADVEVKRAELGTVPAVSLSGEHQGATEKVG